MNLLDYIRIEELYLFLDVFLASLFTMVVGLERERADKAAGIRTNMIIGGFTCLIVSLVAPLSYFLQVKGLAQTISIDPIRVFQAIVVGVSFIGAGTILKSTSESKVTGLTTSATLLYSSGIGITVAIHMYLLAILLTLFIVLINSVVHGITKKMGNT